MRLFSFILILNFLTTSTQALEVDKNIVYQELYRVYQEVLLIKKHFNIDEENSARSFKIVLYPRHNWQKSYEVLVKINIFREKHRLPFVAVSSREPRTDLSAKIMYEQALRLMTEVKILKTYFDISTEIEDVPTFTGKTHTDHFNILTKISAEWDLINSTKFSPSFVFAEAIRISEDINFILAGLEIPHDTLPPPKNTQGIAPKDAFLMTEKIMHLIEKIERSLNIPTIDYPIFRPAGEITPSHVFAMTGIILAELQIIKATLNLKYSLTPQAKHYFGMRPADVQQVMGWCLRKLQLIDSLL